jgi:histidyl-tRNA synthetase
MLHPSQNLFLPPVITFLCLAELSLFAAMKFQSPRGTEDILPADVYRWHFLENTFRQLAAVYGYREIRTPTFEDTNLFLRSVGETSDIVTKEMYEFKDKGDRSMTLKPEGTAGAMRAVIQHSLCPLGTVGRFYYITPIFRYERPQKGRLREPHQVGLELIGVGSPAADAETIEMTSRFYGLLGLGAVTVGLNSIGREECRSRFKEVILVHFANYLSDQPDEFRQRVERNPLRLLDHKDSAVREQLTELPPITDFLEPDMRSHFEELQLILSERKVAFELKPQIVRGLDYYTGTVFEVVSSSLGAQDALCGGGRYDNLAQELGGQPTPSVGVGIGIERALLAMEALKVPVEEPRPEFFAVVASPVAKRWLEELGDQLRAQGRAVIFDLEGKNLKSQLKQAAKYNARFALIVGEDELANGSVTLRDLDAGTQNPVSPNAILSNRVSPGER